MLIIRSDRPALADYDGQEVTRVPAPQEVVVQTQDGTLLIVQRNEVYEPANTYIIHSDRPHVAKHNGQFATKVRAVRDEEGGYSEHTPQSVVHLVTSGERLQVADSELSLATPDAKKLFPNDRPVKARKQKSSFDLANEDAARQAEIDAQRLEDEKRRQEALDAQAAEDERQRREATQAAANKAAVNQGADDPVKTSSAAG